MKLDCIINIMYALQSRFQQSPFFRGLGEELYCYPHLVDTVAFAVLNRLLPVAIVAFRSVTFKYKALVCLLQKLHYTPRASEVWYGYDLKSGC
jgi:hypothetical protein